MKMNYTVPIVFMCKSCTQYKVYPCFRFEKKKKIFSDMYEHYCAFGTQGETIHFQLFQMENMNTVSILVSLISGFSWRRREIRGNSSTCISYGHYI